MKINAVGDKATIEIHREHRADMIGFSYTSLHLRGLSVTVR